MTRQSGEVFVVSVFLSIECALVALVYSMDVTRPNVAVGLALLAMACSNGIQVSRISAGAPAFRVILPGSVVNGVILGVLALGEASFHRTGGSISVGQVVSFGKLVVYWWALLLIMRAGAIGSLFVLRRLRFV